MKRLIGILALIVLLSSCTRRTYEPEYKGCHYATKKRIEK